MEAVMVRIVYEHPGVWPEEGPLRLEAQFSGEIVVPPGLARQRANGYLAREVALFIVSGEPLLILGERPRWQIPAILRLRGLGDVAQVGNIDVDAQTGKVRPLSQNEIHTMREHAHDLADRLVPSPEPAG